VRYQGCSTEASVFRVRQASCLPLYTNERINSALSYIDNSGNTYLVTEAPTDQGQGGYDTTMSFRTDLVSAVSEGSNIPLWYSDEFRLTQLTSGHGFQVRQAERLRDSNEIITFSTVVGDGPGWGKLNGSHVVPGITQYAVMKFSADTGRRTGLWDFWNRSWSSDFNDYFNVTFPANADWSLLPQSANSKKDILISVWENAIKDFPVFFDKRTGLKSGVSLNSQQNTNTSDDPLTTTLRRPSTYGPAFADKIINFNPGTDKLALSSNDFGIDGIATFRAAKNKKSIKSLSKKDIDFIYDQSKGWLYFNENGPSKGFGDAGVCAVFPNTPLLSEGNLQII
jgi:hypothetical protein